MSRINRKLIARQLFTWASRTLSFQTHSPRRVPSTGCNVISKWCSITNALSHAVYDVPVYLSCGVSTLSRRSKTRRTCSKLNDQNIRCLRLLLMNLRLFLPRARHLCNLVVVKRNIVLSTDAIIERILATAAYHWIEVNKTNTTVSSWTQADKYSGSYDVFVIPELFFLKYLQIADASIIYRTTGHPASVRRFSCSECVSRTIRYNERYLYIYGARIYTEISVYIVYLKAIFFYLRDLWFKSWL